MHIYCMVVWMSLSLLHHVAMRYVAARAAARSTIRQQLTEQHGLPIFAREAVVQALLAARATGHPLGSQDMAELVGKMPSLDFLDPLDPEHFPDRPSS